MLMITLDCKNDPNWLQQTIQGLRHVGYAIVANVLDQSLLESTRTALYSAQKKILAAVGEERLKRAGELGVLRLMLKYEPHFIRFLEIPEVLAVIDQTVSETAILHLQNGLILPSFPPDAVPSVFQNRFHMDFPRLLNGYMASVNTMFAIDEFTAMNGGTLLVPGTHQKAPAPSPEYLQAHAIAVECPAGSMIVFDSTLWHAAGANLSGKDRLAINHQFTRSYIKQQVDYVRALGDEAVIAQKPRTQQLLGWYTRVITSLDEYYRPADKRLYRGGQG
jgi:ectoine hydroxylase-related dioxygenase (phytanoyl-CoA dioxygenase family)